MKPILYGMASTRGHTKTHPTLRLGKAGSIYSATDRRRAAAGRLGLTEWDNVSHDGDAVRSNPVEPR